MRLQQLLMTSISAVTSSELTGVTNAPPLLIDRHIELHSVILDHSLHSDLVRTQLSQLWLD